MGRDTLTLAGQTLLHIEFYKDGGNSGNVSKFVAVYPNHDFKKIICIDNKKWYFNLHLCEPLAIFQMTLSR